MEEEAKRKIEEERQTRISSCQTEIQAVLEKYGCSLEAATMIKGDKVISQISIISKI